MIPLEGFEVVFSSLIGRLESEGILGVPVVVGEERLATRADKGTLRLRQKQCVVRLPIVKRANSNMTVGLPLRV